MPKIRGTVNENPVFVAPHSGNVERNQDGGRSGGIEGAVEAVPEIDDLADPSPLDVRQHGLQRPSISMDIRNYRNSGYRHDQASFRSWISTLVPDRADSTTRNPETEDPAR
jgi:hypothetical protein